MRDKNGRAALHDFAEMVEDLVFRVSIHAGKRVVENQNARIANDGAGELPCAAFAPPDKVMPRSPTVVRYFSGNSSMSVAMFAASAAERTSSSVASLFTKGNVFPARFR